MEAPSVSSVPETVSSPPTLLHNSPTSSLRSVLRVSIPILHPLTHPSKRSYSPTPRPEPGPPAETPSTPLNCHCETVTPFRSQRCKRHTPSPSAPGAMARAQTATALSGNVETTLSRSGRFPSSPSARAVRAVPEIAVSAVAGGRWTARTS